VQRKHPHQLPVSQLVAVHVSVCGKALQVVSHLERPVRYPRPRRPTRRSKSLSSRVPPPPSTAAEASLDRPLGLTTPSAVRALKAQRRHRGSGGGWDAHVYSRV
jgi:hypothetical protein